MLFNSIEFLLIFLPLSLSAYWLARRSAGLRCWTLVVLSLIFYGWWDPRLVPLLVASVVVNWVGAGAYFVWRKRGIIIFLITGNLGVLCWFKYTIFLLDIVTGVTGGPRPHFEIVLPLGISFFTFHHIIYLVDCLRGRAPRYSFRDYVLYIVLFPQILAGPLVRHSEIVHQFRLDPWRDGAAERWSCGLVLLTIGLAKKLFLADNLARYAEPIFRAAEAHQLLGVGQSWAAALGFALQIYFDFSGYSDMAIGLALLFGFVLPINFDAPYRSLSVQDFWRRWHMTLSRFLRDYIYIPLGGNRHGLGRQLGALVVTMLLGGLWHGAGWQFVVWGGVHGLGLAVGAWWGRQFRHLPAPLSWALTFLFVTITWVLFRAPTLESAWTMLRAMFGAEGASLTMPSHGEVMIWAALIAILGPTSQTLAMQWLKPRIGFAMATAITMLFVLLHLNSGQSYEFIYFHF